MKIIYHKGDYRDTLFQDEKDMKIMLASQVFTFSNDGYLGFRAFSKDSKTIVILSMTNKNNLFTIEFYHPTSGGEILFEFKLKNHKLILANTKQESF